MVQVMFCVLVWTEFVYVFASNCFVFQIFGQPIPAKLRRSRSKVGSLDYIDHVPGGGQNRVQFTLITWYFHHFFCLLCIIPWTFLGPGCDLKLLIYYFVFLSHHHGLRWSWYSLTTMVLLFRIKDSKRQKGRIELVRARVCMCAYVTKSAQGAIGNLLILRW